MSRKDKKGRRCAALHPMYGTQVRCEERGEHDQHFNSFYMRAWDVEAQAPIFPTAR